jgi:polynucleotide 5'-kinase involved in rRNA processing
MRSIFASLKSKARRRKPEENSSNPEQITRMPVAITSIPDVVIAETGQSSTEDRDDISQPTEEERNKYDRFRVLVLGPRNAGKTTLLERLSNSPVGAARVTSNGRLVIIQILRSNRTLGLILHSSIRSMGRPKGIPM